MISVEIGLGDNKYSTLLKQIPGAPPKLYIKGDLSLLNDRICVAVVGSRKVTPYGRNVTEKLAGELARQGIVVVSGLALGADAIAHQAALDSGGLTIAVLPTSVDRIYPASHYALAKRILDRGGALVSEYSEPVSPQPYCFIARNRIISGLSSGTLITEAAEKSGSLHTANFALEQGREVMAVPGSIFSPYSTGTNNLIKAGATPVSSVEDVLNVLKLEVQTNFELELKGANDQETVLLKLLSVGTSASETLLMDSRLDPSVFNQTLTALEITGRIKPAGGSGWSLA